MSTFAASSGAVSLGAARNHMHGGGDIANGSITTNKIADAAVTGAKMEPFTGWTEAPLSSLKMSTAKIADGTIDASAKVADRQITSAKIANGDLVSHQFTAPVKFATGYEGPGGYAGQRGYFTMRNNSVLRWQMGQEADWGAVGHNPASHFKFWGYHDNGSYASGTYLDRGGSLVPDNYVYTTTSMAALAVRGSFRAGQMPADFAERYTPENDGATVFPIGTHLTYHRAIDGQRNDTARLWKSVNHDNYSSTAYFTELAGTWRLRGQGPGQWFLVQRVS